MASAPVITHCPNPKCGVPLYADHITTWCVECGQPLPAEIQEQLPQLRAKALESLPDRALLERLLALQEQQGVVLADIRRHTGCLYAWLIITVILGSLAFLFGRS